MPIADGPTVAWSVLRDEIARPLGFQDFSATTAINADTLIVSTDLSDRYPSDDYFNGWFVLIESNANAGKVRRVQDYNGEVTSPIGQITVRGAALSDDSSNLASCSLHRFHPTDIRRAFNRARQDVFPQIGIVRDHQLLVTGPNQTVYTLPTTVTASGGQPEPLVREVRRVYVGNRLLSRSTPNNILRDNNGDFETWTGATTPGSWAISGSGASANQESSTTNPAQNYLVLEGQYSARIVVPSSTATTLRQTVTPTVATQGVEVNFSIWTYCTSGSRVRAEIGASTYSAYNTGTGWERLTVGANLGATATNVALGLDMPSVSGAAAVYTDEAIAVIGPSEALEGYWDPVLNYEFIGPSYGQASYSTSTGSAGSIHLSSPLREQQILRVVGIDLLASVSADTDTIEIDGELLGPLYAKTREYLCQEQATRSSGEEYIKWKRLQSEYADDFEEAVRNGYRLKAPNPIGIAPDVW